MSSSSTNEATFEKEPQAACPSLGRLHIDSVHWIGNSIGYCSDLGRVYFSQMSLYNVKWTVGDFGFCGNEYFRVIGVFQATRSFVGFWQCKRKREEIQKVGHPYMLVVPLHLRKQQQQGSGGNQELILSSASTWKDNGYVDALPYWLGEPQVANMKKLSVRVVDGTSTGRREASHSSYTCSQVMLGTTKKGKGQKLALLTEVQLSLLTCLSQRLLEQHIPQRWNRNFKAIRVHFANKSQYAGHLPVYYTADSSDDESEIDHDVPSVSPALQSANRYNDKGEPQRRKVHSQRDKRSDETNVADSRYKEDSKTKRRPKHDKPTRGQISGTDAKKTPINKKPAERARDSTATKNRVAMAILDLNNHEAANGKRGVKSNGTSPSAENALPNSDSNCRKFEKTQRGKENSSLNQSTTNPSTRNQRARKTREQNQADTTARMGGASSMGTKSCEPEFRNIFPCSQQPGKRSSTSVSASRPNKEFSSTNSQHPHGENISLPPADQSKRTRKRKSVSFSASKQVFPIPRKDNARHDRDRHGYIVESKRSPLQHLPRDNTMVTSRRKKRRKGKRRGQLSLDEAAMDITCDDGGDISFSLT